MRKSAITKIMYGESIQDFRAVGDKSKQAFANFCECDQAFREIKKSDEVVSAYKNVVDALNELGIAQAEDSYRKGFAFGVKLGLEIADNE